MSKGYLWNSIGQGRVADILNVRNGEKHFECWKYVDVDDMLIYNKIKK